jgi:RimJ/RimL family protein N-acetyltransferase
VILRQSRAALWGLCTRMRRKFANIRLVRWVRSDRYLLVYALAATNKLPALLDSGINCNRIEDLIYFEQTERWLSREAFVEEAHKRIVQGMKLYTSVINERLVHYSWLVPRQDRAWFPYVNQHYDFPSGAAVLFNAYTHPAARGTGLHSRSMRRRVADAAATAGTTRVYTAIESHNSTSRAVAAKVGFVCVDVLYEITRLGRVRRGRLAPEVYFSLVENMS